MSSTTSWHPTRAFLADLAKAAGPALFYGLRLAAGVGIALYLAFFLQLDNPSWAGTSAAIVAQPVLGASLRKGVFRLIGTVIGAVASVLLTAIFPQNRFGFLFCVALWCAACSFVSTVLRNFAAYAAMLAGYTLVIIASSSIEAPDQVFILAVSRASEIALGIVCGMGVMTLTGFGGSGPRLAGTVSDIAAAIVSGLREDLRTIGDAQPARRDLVGRVIALEPVLDQAMGESAAVSRRRATLRAGVNGLFLALSAWRTTDLHLRSLPPAAVPALAGRLAGLLDAETAAPDAAPAARRDSYLAAAHDARQAPADTAATRLGLDRIASVFEGLGRALNGVVLLGDVRQALPLRGPLPLFVPDVLPPLVNAVRVFAAVGAATLLVIATSWSTGYSFLTFVAVTTLLLSPQNEGASKAIVGFGFGTLLSAALAAFVKFALLPNHEGYASFVLIVSVVLVPVAALATRPAFAGIFTPASMNFIPLLGPTNVISYDTASFVNAALAIIGGCLAGAVVLQVIPPVPPARRAERLLALTLADLRRTLRRPGRVTPDWWRRRIYGRVSALPSSADPADGSRLLSALTVALQMVALRGTAGAAGLPLAGVEAAERALSRGDVEAARAALGGLPADGDGAPASADRLRAAGAAREVVETLRSHAGYFGAVLR